MIIYEVNLLIDNEIYTEYRSWLDAHIREMLKIPGFLNATVMRPQMDAKSDADAQKSITVQYQLEGSEDLQTYLKDYAPKMREDGITRFKDRFTATRRMLEVEETPLEKEQEKS